MFSDNPLNWQEGGDHYARLEYQPVQFIFPSHFIQQAIFFICEIPSLGLAESCLDLLRYRLALNGHELRRKTYERLMDFIWEEIQKLEEGGT